MADECLAKQLQGRHIFQPRRGLVLREWLDGPTEVCHRLAIGEFDVGHQLALVIDDLQRNGAGGAYLFEQQGLQCLEVARQQQRHAGRGYAPSEVFRTSDQQAGNVRRLFGGAVGAK